MRGRVHMLGLFGFGFVVGVMLWALGRSDRGSRGMRHLGGFGFGLALWTAAVFVLTLLSMLFDPQDGCAADICGTWSPLGLVVLVLGWPVVLLGAAFGLPKQPEAGSS